MRYLPNTRQNQRAMLGAIGVHSIAAVSAETRLPSSPLIVWVPLTTPTVRESPAAKKRLVRPPPCGPERAGRVHGTPAVLRSICLQNVKYVEIVQSPSGS